ncbi:hypothetical protein [Nonomuraea lactucae]|nr:hypothetical protein [Nonomuraea lactucae]
MGLNTVETCVPWSAAAIECGQPGIIRCSFFPRP